MSAKSAAGYHPRRVEPGRSLFRSRSKPYPKSHHQGVASPFCSGRKGRWSPPERRRPPKATYFQLWGRIQRHTPQGQHLQVGPAVPGPGQTLARSARKNGHRVREPDHSEDRSYSFRRFGNVVSSHWLSQNVRKLSPFRSIGPRTIGFSRQAAGRSREGSGFEKQDLARSFRSPCRIA